MSIELPREFDVIARYFAPLAGPGGLGLGDDAAVLEPPVGRALVLSADAMVRGVHFLPDDPPDLVARKLLRTNLSDLAAMGADPLGYLLTLCVPGDTPDVWFETFTAGLAADQAEFGVTLLGGDTTSTPGPVSLSLTILGSVVSGRALTRAGARVGDGIWVSGTIGDGALGLLAARGEVGDPAGFLADRYRLPRPRLALGARLHGIARAMMDVSDGLLQDTAHLCRASGLAAEIDTARVPLSAAAAALGAEHLPLCLTGGDDYELLMAVPPANEAVLQRAAEAAAVPVSRIGTFVTGPPRLELRGPDGSAWRPGVASLGWNHLRPARINDALASG